MIESTSPDFPVVLRNGELVTSLRIWATGNLDILKTPLLGFFCSTRCPGNVIVHTYDLARAASPGSKTDRLYAGVMASGKRVYTLDLPENAALMQHGVMGYAVPDLIDRIRR